MDRLHVRSVLPLVILAALVFLFTTKDSSVAVAHSPSKIKWMSLSEALRMAEQHPKPIFVDVYTDWCGWCKKMDKETFTDPQVIEYVNTNYYAVKLDAESDEKVMFEGRQTTYRNLAKTTFKVSGYPSIVYITTARAISTVPGYQVPRDFAAYLKHFNNDK